MKNLLRRLSVLAVLCVLLTPTVAHGVTEAGVSLNEETGGQPARFNLTAVTDKDGPISALTMRFPQGFGIAGSHVQVTTLKGLQRTSVQVTETHEGQDIKLAFKPAIAPGSNLSLYAYDVELPSNGGTFPLQVTYVVNGQTRSIPGLTFSFATIPFSQALANRLDRQNWVKAWNSVKVLNLFAKPQLIVVAVPLLFAGWLLSIGLVLIAFPFAIAGGLGFAFLKMSKLAILRFLASLYINVIRGTPLFLQIFIAFIGIRIVGIRVNDFITGAIVLALNSSAYLAEIFRAGIQSINKGQFEAASSLGMTYPQAMAYVIVPQTVKRVLPTMTSEFILLFKDTALLSAVGVFELMLFSNSFVARSGNLTPFVVAAVYYLLVTIPLINWVASLEVRLAISEGGQVVAEKKRGVLSRMFKPAPPAQLSPEAASGDRSERI